MSEETGIINSETSLRIEGIYDSLGKKEKMVADYITNNFSKVLNKNIEELAEEIDISTATIIRFCKKMGLTGFKNLRKVLIEDLKKKEETDFTADFYDIYPEDSLEEVKEKVFKISSQTLTETLSILDNNDLEKAIHAIHDANKFQIIGMGTSGVVAEYAYYRFFRLKDYCSVKKDPITFKMQVSLLNEKDIMLAISFSGETKKIVEAVQIAKEAGASVISLSDFAISPLTKEAGINLFTTPKNYKVFEGEHFPLIISQINIIDLLYLGIIRDNRKASFENIKKTIESISEEKYR